MSVKGYAPDVSEGSIPGSAATSSSHQPPTKVLCAMVSAEDNQSSPRVLDTSTDQETAAKEKDVGNRSNGLSEDGVGPVRPPPEEGYSYGSPGARVTPPAPDFLHSAERESVSAGGIHSAPSLTKKKEATLLPSDARSNAFTGTNLLCGGIHRDPFVAQPVVSLRDGQFDDPESGYHDADDFVLAADRSRTLQPKFACFGGNLACYFC